jgi:outer membrane receptor for monomeric catechols
MLEFENNQTMEIFKGPNSDNKRAARGGFGGLDLVFKTFVIQEFYRLAITISIFT